MVSGRSVGSAVPHEEQKFTPAGLRCPQFWQNTPKGYPLGRVDSRGTGVAVRYPRAGPGAAGGAPARPAGYDDSVNRR